MPRYEGNRFSPPAPVGHVHVIHPETGAKCPSVPMLIDSGADVTVVPATVAQRLGISLAGAPEYELMAYDGTPRAVPAVRLKVVFLGRTFSGQFLLLEQESGIIGRNILNAIALVLDGPRLTWSEATASRRSR